MDDDWTPVAIGQSAITDSRRKQIEDSRKSKGAPDHTDFQSTADWWTKNAGVPRHVAEGIADNVGRESNFRPTVPGDSDTSIGLYQAHGDRKASLTAMPDWQNPDVQHQWALSQVTGGDKIATEHWEEIKNAKTREEANEKFKKYFARPASEWKPVGVGNARVSDQWIAAQQGRSTAGLTYYDIDALIDALKPTDDDQAKRKTKMQSLVESLDKGDQIEEGPKVDVKKVGNRLEMVDYDGLSRLMELKNRGVGVVPVALVGAGNDFGGITEIKDMHGNVKPFEFKPVPTVPPTASPIRRMTDPYAAAKEVAGRFISAPSETEAIQQQTQQQQPPTERVYQNEAGQPFTLSGAPVPQPAPQHQPERLPGEIPYVGRMSDMFKEIVQGAVMGGERAQGLGGGNPLRPLEPEILTAAAALGGVGRVPGAGRFSPSTAAPEIPAPAAGAAMDIGERAPLSAPEAYPMAQEGRNLLSQAELARAQEFRPSPISPERAQLARDAMDKYDLPLTASDIMPPRQRLAADAIRSIPGSGDLARQNQLRSRWVQEVSKTMGEDSPAITQQVMKDARVRIGSGLERIEQSAPSLKLNNARGSQLYQDVGEAVRKAKRSMVDAESAIVERNAQELLYRKVADKLVPRTEMSGKFIGNELHKNSALSRAAEANTNAAPYVAEIKEALREFLQANLSPEDFAEYRNLRYQYKNMKVIEPLVEKNTTGEISPALLNAQVNKHYGNRAYDVRGEPMDQLATIGQQFVKEPPTSGTAERGTMRWGLAKAAGAGAALVTGHFAGVPLMEEALAAGMFFGGARGLSSYLARPGRAERLVSNALANLHDRQQLSKRNAIGAMMSARGANTLIPPGQQQ